MKNFLLRKKAQEVTHADATVVEEHKSSPFKTIDFAKKVAENRSTGAILIKISLLVIGNLLVILLFFLCYYLL